jgi:AraC family transcriptional regulator, transcriptional activator of the genes for pyochelin and ferripyochelin receptors
MKISEQEYCELFQSMEVKSSIILENDYFEEYFQYPQEFADGYVIDIQLRPGFLLQLADYQFNRPIMLTMEACEHPLEFGFQLAGSGQTQDQPFQSGDSLVCGCGMAPTMVYQPTLQDRQQEVVVHIEPEIFLTFLGIAADQIPSSMQHLFCSLDHPYFRRNGVITPQMQMVLQQIWQCPFEGLVKRIYLESKLLELMALQLQQGIEAEALPQPTDKLKRDTRERIQQAKEILEHRLHCPPSELELAELAGLSHYQLKRGFRQVFGKSPFQYLHQRRMEQARLLLLEGQLRVSEVAIAVGYSHFGQFAAAFKRRFGITPSQC